MSATLRKSRIVRAAIVAATAALVVGALSAASSGKAGGGHHHGGGSGGPGEKVVGQVTALSGSKKLYQAVKSGKLHALHKGDHLHLGEMIEAGPGVSAALKLKTPNGVASDAQLVYVKPVGNTQIVIKLNDFGKFVDVTIGQ